MMTLKNSDNETIEIGDIIADFRGDVHRVVDMVPPHKEGAAGYVYVTRIGEDSVNRFYVTVFDLHWTND